MKRAEDALEALCQLSKADREWMLTALSGAARARLQRLALPARASSRSEGSGAQPVDPPASTAEQTPDTGAEAMLNDAPAARVASTLRTEPAWVIAALLRMRAWRWEENVLGRLAPDQRLEVARLRAALPSLSPKARDALMRELRERVAAVTDRADNGFHQILRRVRPRMGRRRWALEVGS